MAWLAVNYHGVEVIFQIDRRNYSVGYGAMIKPR